MKRILALVILLSVLGIQLPGAAGQLEEVSKGGMTVKLLENTDQCLEDCHSVYQVCGTTISKSDVSMDYKDRLARTSQILDEKVTVTSSKGCYEVRVDGKKNRWEDVDNIPTFKGYEFPEFAWWNTTYKRKQLSVCTYDGDLQNGIEVSYNTNGNGINADGSDFRVIYDDGSATELDRWNITYFNENATDIWFPLQANISNGTCDNSSYYYYYGVASPETGPPTNKSNILDAFEYWDYPAGDSVGSLYTEESGDDWDADGNGNVYVSSYDGKATLVLDESTVGYTDDFIIYGKFRTNSVPNGWLGWSVDGDNNGDSVGAIGTGLCLDITADDVNFMDDTYCGAAFSKGSYSFSANSWYYFEFRKEGTSYEARIWADGEERPTSATHSAIHSSGASGDYYKIIGDTDSNNLINETGYMRISTATVTTGDEEEYVSNYDPEASLISPHSGTTHSDYSITFNCSGTDAEGLSSVALWYSGNGMDWHENDTAALSGTYDFHEFTVDFKDPFQDEEITWNCLVTDNDSATDWADSNYTLTLDFSWETEVYEEEADETDDVEMELIITALSDAVSDVEAYLFYDGNNESYDDKDTDLEGAVNNYTFTATAVPDLVEEDGTNVSFNWVYVIYYTNGSSQEFNITEHNHTIHWAYYPTSADSDPPAVTEGQNVTITVYTLQELSVATVNVSVWFDDTEYPDTTKSGDDYSRELSTTGIDATVYFNGSMNVTYNGITFIRNTTTYSLSVAEIILTNCSADSESQTIALEFWIYDEDDLSELTGNLEVSFDAWSDPSNVVSYSFDFSGDNNYSVCIYPTDATYTIDMMSQFDATGYEPRTYYLNDASISNSSQTIDLYLGSNATQDLITMQVLSSLGLPQEDVYINIAEFNIGTGSYTTVAIANTDYDGKAYTYLTKETKWYRFTVYGDSIDTEMFGPLVIVDDSLTFQLSGGEYGEWLEHYGQLTGGCTFPSNTTTCTVTDTSGLMASARLIVKRWSSLGYIDVCDDTDTGSSITLVCDLGSTTGRIYWYEFSATFQDTHEIIESGYLDYSGTGTDYGDLGLIAAVVLILTMAFMGSWRWEIGLAGAGVGFGLSYVMGIAAMAWGSVVTVFVVIAITIYKSRTT